MVQGKLEHWPVGQWKLLRASEKKNVGPVVGLFPGPVSFEVSGQAGPVTFSA